MAPIGIARHSGGSTQRSGSEASYRLGSKLFELGTKVVSKLDIVERSDPYLRRLVDETGETSHLAVMRDGSIPGAARLIGERPTLVAFMQRVEDQTGGAKPA